VTVAHPRVALVTGAGRGLGAAIAAALHAHGHAVVLADVDAETAAATAAKLDRDGATASSALLDVSDRDAFAALVESVVDRHGSLDVLVNNAGVTPVSDFFEITTEEWDEVLAVNLRSAFVGCQLAGRHMRERGWGRIVNLASIAGQIGSRIAGAHYSVSKGGIVTLTKVAAKELAPHGVTVNAIAPAVVRVPLMQTLPRERLAQLIESIPVGRIGEAEEVGALAAFLASDAAGYVTGATFDINGGQYMR
jgi:3-oxoacyl-[acyl-carrier protein] reductase